MPDNELIPVELTNETIESMIYEIRGQKVMLDFELAEIYGYDTKSFNRQIRNNIARFPDEFRFQLTRSELEELQRCKICTSGLWASGKGGRSYLPWAFTEQGIYMLMTVLRGDTAIKQSIALIKAFKRMKDYILENRPLMGTVDALQLSGTLSDHTRRIESLESKFDVIMDNFIDESAYKHFIILDGEKIEADVAYSEIYAKAKESIIVIDDYIDVKTLQLLRAARDGVSVTVISDNKAKNGITAEYVNDSGIDIRFIYSEGRFHDRYVILDYRTEHETFFHCGASSKDAGNRITAISRLCDGDGYRPVVDEALRGREYSVR